MNLSIPYRLAPDVALRPERFGGLVYRYDDRRLYFLHSHEVVNFVLSLDGQQPLAAALDAFCTAWGLSDAEREALLKSLDRLVGMGIVSACEEMVRRRGIAGRDRGT